MRKLFAALPLLLLATAAFADTSWFAFPDPDGAFSVDMPSTPTVGHDTAKGDNGIPVPMLEYTVDRGSNAEMVIVSDLSTLSLPDGGTVIDNAIGGIKKEAVTVQSDTIANLDGQVGREIHVTDKDGNLITDRVFFVNHKLYQVLHVLMTGADAAAGTDAQHFDDSFHFTH
jgi:hypothetical protein